MEHLQRQQEAKLEMNMHDKHLLHAQLLFAQHAAAARASGSRLDSALSDKADGQTYPAAPPASNSHLGRVDPFGEGKDLQEDEQEMMDPEEHNEGEEEDEENDDDDDDEEEENGCQQHVKKPRLQHVAGSLPTYPTSQVSAVQQMADSPPSATKEEQEEKEIQSPAGQQAFASPGGFTDWGYDETFKQVRWIWEHFPSLPARL